MMPNYDGAEVPPKILAKLRECCLTLPDAYEEPAWVGTRWLVRKRAFAHVLTIYRGRPAAYARAADNDGPLVVMTVRASGHLHDALCAKGHPYFHAAWGTKWGAQVVGIALEGRIKWSELTRVIAASYAQLAPTSGSRRAKSRRTLDSARGERLGRGRPG